MPLSKLNNDMISLFERHKMQNTWRDEPDLFWLAGLVEEVGELAESLMNKDASNARYELIQIGSTVMNWADKWDGESQQ